MRDGTQGMTKRVATEQAALCALREGRWAEAAARAAEKEAWETWQRALVTLAAAEKAAEMAAERKEEK